MKKFFAFCLVVVVSTLSAFTDPCPGEFGVSAEWLYMLPAYDQPYYIIPSSDTNDPVGPRIANEQNWHSGYRIEAIYAFCERPNDVRLRWTHFPTFSDRDTTAGQELFAVLNAPESNIEGLAGTYDFRDTFDVHTLELLFTQRLPAYCGFQLDLFGGVQYGYLDLRERGLFVNPTNVQDLVIHSQRWGIGPEVGYQFAYCFTECFALTGRGHVALLISERESSFSDIGNNSVDAVAKNTSYWDLMPATNLRFGLTYRSTTGWCWMSYFDLEVGYELSTFHNGLDRLFFTDNSEDGLSTDQLMNFTLHGPYVHVGVTF